MELTAFDLFVAQQALLEGYKNSQAREIDPMLEELAALILLLLMRSGYENLGDMPRREMRKLVASVNAKMRPLFASFNEKTLKQMRAFLGVAVDTNRRIVGKFKRVPGDKVPTAAKLWGQVANDPIPGAGIDGGKIVSQFLASAGQAIERTIKRAYADKLTPAQLMKELTGTKANKFRDGLINKLRNQFVSASDTLIQYVQQSVIAFIGSIVTDKYQWVSVIDSATTDICRGRNGNVYEYMSGPRPPAHYRCRSTIIPLFGTATAPIPSYGRWIAAQPAIVQDNVLGRGRAVALRNGKLANNEITNFDGMRPLTLEEYKATNRKLLTN